MIITTDLNLSQFNVFQAQVIRQLEKDINNLFSTVSLASPLQEACHYAMMGKGKRVRPLLVASTFMSLASGTQSSSAHISVNTNLNSNVRRAMLAVELLHTYSLVHDDLPCMDDDELRRGRATTHIKFGEATAMLTGDVLQTLAFEVLGNESAVLQDMQSIDSVVSANLLVTFAQRARRMVSGQMMDLQGENKTLTQYELESIHRDKTGALIEASVLMGAICARDSGVDLNDERLRRLTEFAQNLGLAFQVQDDILDVTMDTDQLGKPSGSDEKLDKSTYVKLMGIENSKKYAESLFNEAITNLRVVFSEDVMLMQLADWLWKRKR